MEGSVRRRSGNSGCRNECGKRTVNADGRAGLASVAYIPNLSGSKEYAQKALVDFAESMLLPEVSSVRPPNIELSIIH